MAITAFFRANFPFLMLLLLVFAVVGMSTVQGMDMLVYNAIAVDLMVSIPLIYLLIIYKKPVAKTTVIPVVVIGYILGSLLLPEDTLTVEYAGLYAIPLVEFGALGYLVYNIRRLRKRYLEERFLHPSPITALKETFAAFYPRAVSGFLSYELSMIYYAFAPARKSHKTNHFYYAASGSSAIYVAILFLVLVETFVLHLLLVNYSAALAWTLSGLSIYSGIIILGIMRSRSHLPVLVFEDKVFLRYGIWRSAEIPIDYVEAIEKRAPEDGLYMSPLGEMETHNLVLKLAKPVEVQGLYGFNKKASSLAFYVDDPDSFKKSIQA